jgi:HSP20 family protein
MTRFRWQGFGDLREELSRLQRELQRSVWRDGSAVEELPADSFPPVNVWEDHDHLYVEAELPGCEQPDLELLVHGRRLTIQGRRHQPPQDKGVWHRQERGYGTFSRSLDLPAPVDPDQIEADLRSGILMIRLAKHAEVRPRRIVVKEA